MTVKPFSRRRRLRYRPGSVSGGALAAFLLPFFVPFVLFYLAPVVYAVYQSLLTIERGDGMFGERRMVFGGLTQYVAVLGDTEFWAGLGAAWPCSGSCRCPSCSHWPSGLRFCLTPEQ